MRMFGGILLLLATTFLSADLRGADTAKSIAASKKALQELNEFIGTWNGTGEPKDGKGTFWKEKQSWGWKFKGDESWMGIEFTDNKGLNFAKGDLRYLADKKLYQLTVTTTDKKELVFEGDIKRKVLTLTRTDPETKDVATLTMSTNNEGARMISVYSVQAKGKGIAQKKFEVQNSKEGASIASGKKQECVVTGGLGTMPVSYNGKTYYVCCSGCRDAFNETPKKFVDAFEKKK